eukprot:tig00000865_g5110.t1
MSGAAFAAQAVPALTHTGLVPPASGTACSLAKRTPAAKRTMLRRLRWPNPWDRLRTLSGSDASTEDRDPGASGKSDQFSKSLITAVHGRPEMPGRTQGQPHRGSHGPTAEASANAQLPRQAWGSSLNGEWRSENSARGTAPAPAPQSAFGAVPSFAASHPPVAQASPAYAPPARAPAAASAAAPAAAPAASTSGAAAAAWAASAPRAKRPARPSQKGQPNVWARNLRGGLSVDAHRETAGVGVTVVRTRAEALEALAVLRSEKARYIVGRDGKRLERYHAWDTETRDLDASKQTPVGNGRAICASCYVGPDVDFGTGPHLWVDNLDEAEGTLDVFREYFEDASILKVWHNYGFDRHILHNHGIDVRGFGGDTMHMARLQDAARDKATGGGGYSLESLSTHLLPVGKVSMKDRFARAKIKKDGTESKVKEMAPPEELQRTMGTRREWIHYACLDVWCTWWLRELFEASLQGQAVEDENVGRLFGFRNMWEFYVEVWRPFGEILTDIERRGFKINVAHLRAVEEEASRASGEAARAFVEWVRATAPEETRPFAHLMNIKSANQIRQLLFAPCWKEGKGAGGPGAGQAEAAAEEARALQFGEADVLDVGEFEEALELSKPRAKGKKKKDEGEAEEEEEKDPDFMPEVDTFEVPNEDGFIEEGKTRAKKKRSIAIAGMGLPVVARTASGWPSTDQAALRRLAGKAPSEGRYGLAFEHFEKRGTPGGGAAACAALDALCEATAVDTLLETFIRPLQELAGADAHGRIHASLNLNTETGRLSCRRPNLQNQPALEKDRYKIRDAFTCEEGHTLIVADYGQLELRILAHIAGCVSMRDAFLAGGDFHSRTALGMYDHIKAAIDRGECLLEEGPDGNPQHLPLLKDLFAAERRKAKTLNFSIAYGKTAHGLARDWGVSVEEAQATVDRWYADRPEVKDWQLQTIRNAESKGYTTTLMGRRRPLPGIRGRGALASHLRRAAINTPIQGGAADIVMCAMVKLARNQRLSELGWRMVLQVHDEVIVEGPRESADEALEIVRACMEQPLPIEGAQLFVPLVVDSRYAETWYRAK